MVPEHSDSITLSFIPAWLNNSKRMRFKVHLTYCPQVSTDWLEWQFVTTDGTDH